MMGRRMHDPVLGDRVVRGIPKNNILELYSTSKSKHLLCLNMLIVKAYDQIAEARTQGGSEKAVWAHAMLTIPRLASSPAGAILQVSDFRPQCNNRGPA